MPTTLAGRTETLPVSLRSPGDAETFGYAPFEQYAEVGALRQGARTGLNTRGATLRDLPLGLPPLPASARALHDESPPLAGQALPGVSLRCAQTLDGMLSPRPQDRPQSVDMLRDALQGRVSLPALVGVACDGGAGGPHARGGQHMGGATSGVDSGAVRGSAGQCGAAGRRGLRPPLQRCCFQRSPRPTRAMRPRRCYPRGAHR